MTAASLLKIDGLVTSFRIMPGTVSAQAPVLARVTRSAGEGEGHQAACHFPEGVDA